jgi:hypothetical protein
MTPTLVCANREMRHEHDEEDDEMLIRLVKVRKKLWT